MICWLRGATKLGRPFDGLQQLGGAGGVALDAAVVRLCCRHHCAREVERQGATSLCPLEERQGVLRELWRSWSGEPQLIEASHVARLPLIQRFWQQLATVNWRARQSGHSPLRGAVFAPPEGALAPGLATKLLATLGCWHWGLRPTELELRRGQEIRLPDPHRISGSALLCIRVAGDLAHPGLEEQLAAVIQLCYHGLFPLFIELAPISAELRRTASIPRDQVEQELSLTERRRVVRAQRMLEHGPLHLLAQRKPSSYAKLGAICDDWTRSPLV